MSSKEKQLNTSRFSEQETEQFYDLEDALYRSFWDEAGSLHWGLFDEGTGDDFHKACLNLNEVMAEQAGIGPGSRVLDLGCGNGNTAMWYAERRGCHVVGVALSGVRVGHARTALAGQPPEMRRLVSFEKASATELPFADDRFTHVMSQATIYHVPDKEKVLSEVYRVLAAGGVFAFDDLTKPKPDISEAARKFVYDRLLYDTDFSFESYQEALKQTGFQIREARDLSAHLKTSYLHLARMARQKVEEDQKTFAPLAVAYDHMAEAIDNRELGWALYVSEKRAPREAAESNRVQWVYSSRDSSELSERYDEWAKDYDSDLEHEFGWVAPRRVVEVFTQYVLPTARVLDAGVGTGLVGQVLADGGYRNLVGLDLSQGMLDQASEKEVYRELHKMELGKPLGFPDGSLDAVISVGVLTLGHAPPSSFDELIRITKPGGHIVFGMRTDVYEEGGFKQKQSELESQGRWESILVTDTFQPLPKGEPEVLYRVWVYRVAEAS